MQKIANSYKEYLQNIDTITHLELGYDEAFDIEKLKQLKGLTLSSSRYTEFPSWIQHLTNLEALEIGMSKITSLPDWLPQLKKLKVFRFDYSELKQLPPFINQMKQLEELSFNCSLESFPFKLELPELKILNLENCFFPEDAPIVDCLIHLPKLASYIINNIHSDVYNFDKFFTTLCKKRSALLDKDKVHPEALIALCFIFLKKIEAVQKIDPTKVYSLLNASSAPYRKMVLDYLNTQAYIQPKSLAQKHVFIIGKLTVKKKDYTTWLEDTGAILDKKISPATDYIILGEKPGKNLDQIFPYQDKIILEQTVWDLKKTPYLQNEAPEVTQNLQDLLQNPAVENLEIALQIMEVGGMPDHLIEEIAGIMLYHKSNKIRKKAQLIFDRYLTTPLSTKAQALLEEKAYRIKEDKKVTQYLRNLAVAAHWDLAILAHAAYRSSGKEQAEGLCLMLPKVSNAVIRDYINSYEQVEFKSHTGLANGLYLEHIPPAVVEISKEVETIYLKGFKFKDEDYLKLSGFKGLKLDFGHSRKIPASIFSNTQLERLELVAYNIKKISSLIGNLTLLKELRLSLLNATALPKEFGNLQQLKKLSLSLSLNTEIEVPPCIGKLTTLESWYMSYPVTNFPKELEQLVKLKRLNIKVSEQCSPEDRARLELLEEQIKNKEK